MKIVIVEDEISIRNGLSRMLPKLGEDCEVVGVAENGREGLEVVTKTLPDLLIMDIHMPEMDGLTMLEKIRERGVACRVVVLTAYSDFSYAKRTIELNIENYLLKPIKLPELKKVLDTVRKSLERDMGTKILKEQYLSLEQIFRGSILAELPIDEELNKATKEKYDLDVTKPLALFFVWLGDQYEDQSENLEKLLEEYTGRADDYKRSVICLARQRMVGVILYHMTEPDKIRKRYEQLARSVISRLCRCVMIFNWEECENLSGLADAFDLLQKRRMWNLTFPQGTVISDALFQTTKITALKCVMDMDVLIRQAAFADHKELFFQSVEELMNCCKDGFHQPEEIREIWIRFCMGVLTFAKSSGRLRSSVAVQDIVGTIAQAVTWQEIQDAAASLNQGILFGEEDPEISLLVKRAKQMIEEYYSQGITLEEIADRLCVSEEYLSTQFKKETGVTFRDTMKRYRIEKIKELLLHSNLKLNQIADMVGYSDPKYMSKVFRDEVGMLPAEFRKMG